MSKPTTKAITKALLKRCQNENLQCLAGLRKTDPEAAAAIEAMPPRSYRDFLGSDGVWSTSGTSVDLGRVYRLHPNTPTDEYEDLVVDISTDGMIRVDAPGYGLMPIARAAAHKDCLGFVYGSPEAPVLRTVLDLQYGQPFAVRFRVGS